MVIYKCNKCNKEFNQKTNYISHINKKISCIDCVAQNVNDEINIIISLLSIKSHNKHVHFV
jgi:DNA-directed RNA polymerase subunit RPC12/RpoP